MKRIEVDKKLMYSMKRKERLAYVREINRLERERQAQAKKRRKVLTWVAAGAAVVIAAGVTTAVFRVNALAAQRGPENMLSDGVQFTANSDQSGVTVTSTAALAAGASPEANTADYSTGVLDAVVYLDYSDPASAAFWAANGSSLESWTAAGSTTLEIHPVALGATSDDDYAVRAAAALACTVNYDPDNALVVNDALLAAVTASEADDGTALSIDNLESIVTNAGVTDSDVGTCISAGDYTPWVQAASARAAASTVVGSALTGTPGIFVGGEQFTGDPTSTSDFETFMTSTYTALMSGDDSSEDADDTSSDE